jgi:hypothetical protein
MRPAVLVCVALLVCAAGPLRAQAPVISLSTKPSPLLLGQNRFEVKLATRAGKPLTGAAVTVSMTMPAMPAIHHPEMRSDAVLPAAAPGTYNGVVMVTMAGSWTVQVTVRHGGRVIGRKQLTMMVRERVGDK